jgi:hypothetical protein
MYKQDKLTSFIFISSQKHIITFVMITYMNTKS